MNAKSDKLSFYTLRAILKGIKYLLWTLVIGLGFTLIQTTALIFTTNQLVIDVGINNDNHIDTLNLGDGDLFLNKGSLVFKSSNFLDKVLLKHVYGYYDFLPSLFNFSICLILLLIIRNIEVNSPYSLKIAKKIQWIGLLYITFGFISILVSLYTHFKVIEFSNKMLPQFSTLRNDMSGIIVGIFILILAFIYRVGVHFQEENKLTI